MVNNQESFFIKFWKCIICRIGIIAFTSVIVLIFLLSVLANPVLNWIVKPQILNSINNDKTDLQIKAIDFSLIQNKITLYNIILKTNDSSQSESYFTIINIPHLSVSGMNWFSFLFKNGDSFGDIVIDKPKIIIQIYNYTDSSNRIKDSSKASDLSPASKLSKLIPDKLNPLQIDNIIINSVEITRTTQYAVDKKDKTIDSVKNLSLILSDIYLDKNADYKDGKKSVLGNYELNIKEFHRKIFSRGYDFKISSLTASGSSPELKIKELNLLPYISDEEFFKGNKYRRDRLIIKIPEIVLTDINLIKFCNENFLL